MFSSEGATAATVGCEDELGMAGNQVQNDLWPSFGREDNASGPSRRQHNYGKTVFRRICFHLVQLDSSIPLGSQVLDLDRQNEEGETEDEVQF